MNERIGSPTAPKVAVASISRVGLPATHNRRAASFVNGSRVVSNRFTFTTQPTQERVHSTVRRKGCSSQARWTERATPARTSSATHAGARYLMAAWFGHIGRIMSGRDRDDY